MRHRRITSKRDYEAAFAVHTNTIALIASMNGVIWSTHAAFISVTLAIVAGYGALLTTDEHHFILVLVLGAIGAIFSHMMMNIFDRNQTYYFYYWAKLREIEKHYFPRHLRAATEGAKISQGLCAHADGRHFALARRPRIGVIGSFITASKVLAFIHPLAALSCSIFLLCKSISSFSLTSSAKLIIELWSN